MSLLTKVHILNVWSHMVVPSWKAMENSENEAYLEEADS